MEQSSILRIGEYFQEYTKYKYFTRPSEMSLGKPSPDPEKPYDPDLTLIDLPDGEKVMFASACLGQEMFTSCAVSFIWTAVIERSRWKYQQRAYRYIHLDAGHICQNLYFACEVLGLGCCAVAAFDDDAVNEIIGVDGKEEFVIYLSTVGYIN